jgi:hypothetical protein
VIKAEKTREVRASGILRDYNMPNFKSRAEWGSCSASWKSGPLAACNCGSPGSKSTTLVSAASCDAHCPSLECIHSSLDSGHPETPVVHSRQTIKHEVIAVSRQETRPPLGIVGIRITIDNEITNSVQIGP